MKNKMRILFLSSEVAPFAKTGGLADVSSSLPKTLFDMGHDVRVIMPKYGPISERKYILREVIRLKKIAVKMGNTEHITCGKSAFIPDSKVQVYFLDYGPYFSRSGLYVEPKTGKDYPDNAERFMLFCRAVLETIKLLHWQPQIIHCNDWQTAMIPWLLKNEYDTDDFFTNTSTLLSIHNMAYQGRFDLNVAKKIGLDGDYSKPESSVEIYNSINYLKAGIISADAISTVSPTYAKEIQSDEVLGAGLHNVLKQRKGDLFGIQNGVDYSIWDPEIDTLISQKYSLSDMDGKLLNKKELVKKANLPFDENIPVIGIVSRLDDQKGFDLLAKVIEKIVLLNAQLVVLGTGDPKYHNLFTEMHKKFPKNIAVFLTFDEEFAHWIEAGSDIFLMPSKYEPCGLNQLYSLKYGTVPVVRKTGGLVDTIRDFVKDPEKGNGFVFEEYDSYAMLNGLQNAIKTFQDSKTWRKIQKRGMRADYSWKISAENYIKLYQKLESNRRKG